MVARAHFILYVEDRGRSSAFYRQVLGSEPALDVPGMTEFHLGGAVLGLMPAAGIRRLLGDGLPDPTPHAGFARGEIYLLVDAPAAFHARALAAGGRELSSLSRRDWGDDVAYSLDLDGYVLAFARRP